MNLSPEHFGFAKDSNQCYTRSAHLCKRDEAVQPVFFLPNTETSEGYVLSIAYGNFPPARFAFQSANSLLMATVNQVFINCAIWELAGQVPSDHAETLVDTHLRFPNAVESIYADQLDLTTSQLCDLTFATFRARSLQG